MPVAEQPGDRGGKDSSKEAPCGLFHDLDQGRPHRPAPRPGFPPRWLVRAEDTGRWASSRNIERSPRHIGARIGLAITYGELERVEEAKREAAEIVNINPAFAITRYANALTYKNPEHAERALGALRKAGLPE